MNRLGFSKLLNPLKRLQIRNPFSRNLHVTTQTATRASDARRPSAARAQHNIQPQEAEERTEQRRRTPPPPAAPPYSFHDQKAYAEKGSLQKIVLEEGITGRTTSTLGTDNPPPYSEIDPNSSPTLERKSKIDLSNDRDFTTTKTVDINTQGNQNLPGTFPTSGPQTNDENKSLGRENMQKFVNRRGNNPAVSHSPMEIESDNTSNTQEKNNRTERSDKSKMRKKVEQIKQKIFHSKRNSSGTFQTSGTPRNEVKGSLEREYMQKYVNRTGGETAGSYSHMEIKSDNTRNTEKNNRTKKSKTKEKLKNLKQRLFHSKRNSSDDDSGTSKKKNRFKSFKKISS